MSRVTMQTPDELLRDLEKMGESAVRERLVAGHFADRKVPLIEGWLHGKERERDALQREAAERRKPREKDRAVEAVGLAHQAKDAAGRALRQAQIGAVLGGVGVLLGLAALVVAAVK